MCLTPSVSSVGAEWTTCSELLNPQSGLTANRTIGFAGWFDSDGTIFAERQGMMRADGLRDLDQNPDQRGSRDCRGQESQVVRRLGLEPRTHGLKGRCSTN